MKTNNVNSVNFNAALRVTNSAKNSIYHSNSHNTVVSNLVFNRTMSKLEDKLCGEFPFAGDVFFDTISKKTKTANPHTNSQYELRLFDKSVDFNFDHNRIFHNHEHRPIEEKIEHEADTQSNYLFNAYLYLRRQFGK